VVEYLALARTIHVRGALETGWVHYRPPLFPLLLSTLFPVVELLFGDDLRPVMWGARLFQCAVSIALMLVTVRIGTALGGRRVGLVAGLLVAVNPIVMRHGLDPIADPLAGLLLGLGVERAIVRGSRGRALAGGVLCGLACMIAFKAIPIVALLALALLVRDRGPRLGCWASFVCGILAMLGVQYVLDRTVYGEWGYSIENYFWQSFGFLIPSWLMRLGFKEQAISVVTWIREDLYGLENHPTAAALSHAQAQDSSPTWYLTEAPRRFIVWPALLCLLIGLARCLRRPTWPRSIAILLVLGYVAVLMGKGSKSFRLLIPALPLLAPLCALGWEALRGRSERPGPRVLAAWGLLVATALLSAHEFRQREPRRLGHYWQAVAWLDRLVEREQAVTGDHRARRVASDYGFATRFRSSPNLRDIHLSLPLAEYVDPRPGLESQSRVERRRALLNQVANLQFLIVSDHAVRSSVTLSRVLGNLFRIEAAFLGEGHDRNVGPVYVLRRVHPAAEGTRFHRLLAPSDAPDAPALAGFRRIALGEPASDEAPEVLELVGYEYKRLPGSGLQWMSWSLRAKKDIEAVCVLQPHAMAPNGAKIPLALVPVQRGQFQWSAGSVLVRGGPLRGADRRPYEGPVPAQLCSILWEVGADGARSALLQPVDGEGSGALRAGPVRGSFCLSSSRAGSLTGKLPGGASKGARESSSDRAR
jgi:hypothetical protein